MLGTFHTISYPVGWRASRGAAYLPAKTPEDVRRYAFDFSRFAVDAGTNLASAFLLADPSLMVAGASVLANQVLFTVGGGAPSTPRPVISFAILFADGQREDITVIQPIDPLAPAIPAGAVAVGSQPLTLDHVPIDVSEMQPLPGGAQASDLLLLYRPGSPSVMGVIPWAGLPSGGGGTVTFVQSSPSTTWTVTHNLGRYPSVDVVTTSGDLVAAAVHYASANQVVLSFASAFAGTAYLN